MRSNLQRLQKLSVLLDSQFTGPYGLKFGLDPVVGLIPVIGDAVTSFTSFYIVYEAYRMGCGFSILFRMAFNIFLEDLVKVIPLFGQIFDFYWKSNLKNIHLLEKFIDHPQLTRRNSTWLVFILGLTMVMMLLISLALSIYIVQFLITKLF